MTCKKSWEFYHWRDFPTKTHGNILLLKNPLSQMLRNLPLKMIFLKCMKLYFPSLIFHHHLEFSTEVHFLNQKNKIMRNYLSKYHFKHSSDFHKIFLLPKIKQNIPSSKNKTNIKNPLSKICFRTNLFQKWGFQRIQNLFQKGILLVSK